MVCISKFNLIIFRVFNFSQVVIPIMIEIADSIIRVSYGVKKTIATIGKGERPCTALYRSEFTICIVEGDCPVIRVYNG